MRFSFGPYLLDTDRHELTCRGEAVSVEPQVFHLLAFLIENRNRVVSRDDLINAIWDGRFISDAAVSSRIKSARQAIGDDGKTQHSIRTVHGKGIRFVADVTADAESETLEKPLVVADPPKSKNPANRWPALLAVCAIVFVGLVAFLGSRSGPSEQVRIAVLPIVNATGDDTFDWTEYGLMSLIVDDIGRSTSHAMIPSRSVAAALDGEEPPETGDLRISDGASDKLHQVYGASHVLLTRLTLSGGSLQLESQLFGPRGALADQILLGGDPTALALDMGRFVLSRLPDARVVERETDTVSTNPFVIEAYARGRAFQYQGRAEDALKLFQVAADQEPENFWLAYEIALTLRMVGDIGASETKLNELLERAQGMGQAKPLALVFNGLGRLRSVQGDQSGAIEHFLAALEAGQPLNDHARNAAILTNLGIEERRRGNLEKAEAYLIDAMSEYDKAGYGSPPGELLNSLGLLKFETGEFEEVERYLQRAAEAFQLSGAEHYEASAIKNLGEAYVYTGRWDKAAQFYLKSLEIRDRLDNASGRLSSLAAISELRLLEGRFEDAEPHARALLQLAEQEGREDYEAEALEVLGDIARYRGAHRTANRDYSDAISIETRRNREGDVVRLTAKQLLVAEMSELITEEILAERLEQFASSAETLESTGLRVYIAEIRGELALRQLALGEAKSFYSFAYEASLDLKYPSASGRLAARLGRIELAMGNVEAATENLAFAKNTHPDHYETRLLESAIAAYRGEADTSEALMRQARSAANDHWLRVEEELPLFGALARL